MSSEFSQWVAGLDMKRKAKGDLSARSGFSQAEEMKAFNNQLEDSRLEEDDPAANLKELEQEMKLLKWHKLANEAALKAALIKTKRLKSKESMLKGGSRQVEKAAWMQQVIQEEQSKPLEVSEEFIREYQERERQDNKRVERDIKVHMANLERVKNDVQQREEQKARNETYREKKKLLEMKQKQIQEASLHMGRQIVRGAVDTMAMLEAPNLDHISTDKVRTVATSLDRLVELEKRITKLEHDYDAKPKKSRGGNILFSKKTGGVTSTAIVPSKSARYHVHVKRSAVRKKDQTSTFMTSLPDINNKSNNSNSRKRSSSTSRGSGGTSRSRSRSSSSNNRQMVVHSSSSRSHSKSSSSRVRAKLRGAQRQDAVVSNWLKDRSTRGRTKASRTSRNTEQSTALVPAGETRTSRHKNAKQHLQEFRQVRKQFDRKKQQMMRTLHAKNESTSRTRQPIKRKQILGSNKRTTPSSTSTRKTRSGTGMVVRNVGRSNARLGSVKFLDKKQQQQQQQQQKLVGRNGSTVRTRKSKSQPQQQQQHLPKFGVIGKRV